MSKIFPLSEYEQYQFDDDPFSKEESADMPQGFDYIANKSADGFVKLDYIDFYDYLPKEDLSKFMKELKKCVRRNKVNPFGVFRSRKDIDEIDNFGQYYDGQSFTHILSVRFRKNKIFSSIVRIFQYHFTQPISYISRGKISCIYYEKF